MKPDTILLASASVCIMLLFYYFVSWFITTKFFIKIKDLIGKAVNGITGFLGITAGKYQDYIAMMNSYRRDKNIIYKYHFMMNVAIESLGLRNITNVQTVTFFILVGSAVATSLLTIGMNLAVSILLYITLVIFFHLLLVFVSRSRTIKRSIALMDAEDILCTSMEDGIQVAVDRNIKAIDPAVRYMFEEMRTEINLKEPMGTVLDNLNTKAGKQLDSFCQTAYNHYRDNDPIALTAFSDNILRNSKRRIAIAQQQANYSASLRWYFIGLLGCVIFVLVMVNVLGAGGGFFFTLHGRVATIVAICFLLLGFVASQIIFSGGVD